MRKQTAVFIFFFTLLMTTVRAQDFSFSLYLEDATGARDTIVLGYDSLATDSIDIAFGETNLLGQSWGSSLEVRATNFEFWNSTPATYYNDDYAYYSEPCILENQCSNPANNMLAVLHLKNVVYPLTVSWDSTVFADPCRSDFIITDWQPEAWFDVTTGDIELFELKDYSAGVFDSVIARNITMVGDTTDLIYVGAPYWFGTSIETVPMMQSLIYPNPVQHTLFVETDRVMDNMMAYVYTTYGQLVQTHHQITDGIDVQLLPEGMYCLVLVDASGAVENQLFQKVDKR